MKSDKEYGFYLIRKGKTLCTSLETVDMEIRIYFEASLESKGSYRNWVFHIGSRIKKGKGYELGSRLLREEIISLDVKHQVPFEFLLLPILDYLEENFTSQVIN